MQKESKELAFGLGLLAILLVTAASIAKGGKRASKPKTINILQAGTSYMVQGITSLDESFEDIAKRLEGVDGLQDAEVMPNPKENGTREVMMVIRPKIDMDVSAPTYYFNGVPVRDIKVAPV